MSSALENFIAEVATETGNRPANDQKTTRPHLRSSASSALTDIREMARRYRRMRDLEAVSIEVLDSWSLAESTVCEPPIMLPDAEKKESRAGKKRLGFVLTGVGAVALTAATAALTIFLNARGGESLDGGALAGPVLAGLGQVEHAVADGMEDSPLVIAPERVVTEPEAAERRDSGSAGASAVEAHIAEAAPEETAGEESDRVARESSPARAERRVAPAQDEPQEAAAPASPETIDERSVAAASTDSEAPICDEVLCLLEGRSCCGDQASDPEPVVDEPELPTQLSRADIEAALESVSGRLTSCGSKHGVIGPATVKFRILGSGRVASADTKTGDSAFQQCIASTAKKVVFARTADGVTISYPVVMR